MLQRFDDLLIHIRDGRVAPVTVVTRNHREETIEEEMRRPVEWGISPAHGGLPAATAAEVNIVERAAIEARRTFYADTGATPGALHAAGLALSGGGIRSATFSLGVLVALARRGVLPQIDYLSTVSGGGYLGAFLTAFLSASGDGHDAIGLCPKQVPFSRTGGEAAALRHIRHHSKYLASGSWWGRLQIVGAQVYGMVLNTLAMVYIVVCAVLAERVLRAWPVLNIWRSEILTIFTTVLIVAAVAALGFLRFSRIRKGVADALVTWPAVGLAGIAAWYLLPDARAWMYALPSRGGGIPQFPNEGWVAIVGAIPIVLSALASFFTRRFVRTGLLLVILASIAIPLFFATAYLVIYQWADTPTVTLPFGGTAPTLWVLVAVVVVGGLIYFFVFDLNATATHRHYRDKLAEAYLIQPRGTDVTRFDSGVAVPLSTLGKQPRAPYHLINAALNVPGSKNPTMQGRLTDFFLFSARYCGTPLTGYFPTEDWERRDPHLDLGTAMAVSGAAAAPQMGLGTMRHLSFWLALLNVRLGYWLPNPAKPPATGAPGLVCLLREMLGNMHEESRWLNVSDGGHIENLGVYELLRRRCKVHHRHRRGARSGHDFPCAHEPPAYGGDRLRRQGRSRSRRASSERARFQSVTFPVLPYSLQTGWPRFKRCLRIPSLRKIVADGQRG